MLSFVFIFSIVPAVVGLTIDIVRGRFRKKNVVDCEEDLREVRSGPPMPPELRAFIDAREKAKKSN